MILDASALVAFFRDERGQEVVANALAESAGVCTVNVSEAAVALARRGMPYERIASLIERLPVIMYSADLPLSLAAAQIHPLTRQFGLSLGDRFCLALAKRENRPVLTGDPIWRDAGPLIGVEVRLIR